MMELIGKTKIDFMGLKKYAFAFSICLSVLGLTAIVQVGRGAANLGIDFAGGTAVQMKFSGPVSVSEVRAALEAAGIKDLDIQDFPTVNKVLIKVKANEAVLGNIANKIVAALQSKFGSLSPVVDSTTQIGPKVGTRLRKDALVAVMAATLGILIYVAIRFQFRFGIGATIATFHDVLAVLGIFYLMGKEINLILLSALLLIAGYSLTDTVVVFDRIRENLKKNFRDPVETIINSSVNEVLSRTVIVSLTTLFSALALFLFGGEVIHDFALAIIMGIVIGTYSSVFVASPVVALMGGKRAIGK